MSNNFKVKRTLPVPRSLATTAVVMYRGMLLAPSLKHLCSCTLLKNIETIPTQTCPTAASIKLWSADHDGPPDGPYNIV
jgi:hypothetical protein